MYIIDKIVFSVQCSRKTSTVYGHTNTHSRTDTVTVINIPSHLGVGHKYMFLITVM